MSTQTLFSRFLLALAFIGSVGANSANAGIVPHFLDYTGTPNGQFAWDDFSGSPHGPHDPDAIDIGDGSANISVVSLNSFSGIIAGSGNLYSLDSIPMWTVNLSELNDTEGFTSIGLQIGTTAVLDLDDFKLGGTTVADNFEFVETVAESTSDTRIYSVIWDGLTADDNYFIDITAGGNHTSFSGAEVVYFNTDTPFAIEAVPEPTTLVLSSIGILGMLAFGLGRQAPKKKKVAA